MSTPQAVIQAIAAAITRQQGTQHSGSNSREGSAQMTCQGRGDTWEWMNDGMAWHGMR